VVENIKWSILRAGRTVNKKVFNRELAKDETLNHLSMTEV